MTVTHLADAAGGDVGGLKVPDAAELMERARRIGPGRLASWLGVTAAAGEALGGNLTGAARRFRAALREAENAHHYHGAGFAVMGVAGTAAVAGDVEAAARLHGALGPHLVTLRSAMPAHYFAAYEEAMATARHGLAIDDDRRAVTAGAAWSWEETCAAAIETADRLAALAPAPDPVSVAAGPLVADSGGGAPPLTPRDLEVLAALATGDTNKDVARHLGITAKTVMHHAASIYQKLAVRGRAEAATYALRHHLIDRPTNERPTAEDAPTATPPKR